MSHYGILSFYLTGHLNTAMAIARGLEERGHQVTFFGIPDSAAGLRGYGFEVAEIGGSIFPPGTLRAVADLQASLTKEEAFTGFIQQIVDFAGMVFDDLPAKLREYGTDALVIDQFFPGGTTTADHMSLPYVSFASAVPINLSRSLPPPNLPWDYDPTPAGRERYRLGWEASHSAFTRWAEKENEHRTKWNLKPFKNILEDSFSPYGQIAQIPACFDFPREDVPANFHYVGPLSHPETRSNVEFPWDKLDDRPLVYASLGTMQNGLEGVFRVILDACSTLDVQLVLSTGGRPVVNLEPSGLPDNAIVVRYAPQYELLKRASLCITHGGLNTTLEALSNGVPLVAIPIAHDQTGVGARIRWKGCGTTISLEDISVSSLREAITRVLTQPHFRQAAEELQSEIVELDPVRHACDLIEAVTRQFSNSAVLAEI